MKIVTVAVLLVKCAAAAVCMLLLPAWDCTSYDCLSFYSYDDVNVVDADVCFYFNESKTVAYTSVPLANSSETNPTRSHPEIFGDMSRVTLNFDLSSEIPFAYF